jgi:transcriptional regulator with XRE-family HTH domain
MPQPTPITMNQLLDRQRIWTFDPDSVRSARLSCRCTQTRLATRLGISVRHLRRIETGLTWGGPDGFRIRTGYTLQLFDRLCFELGLEYDELLRPQAMCAA